MKIEVLYFYGCPNHVAAVERLREILTEENVSDEIVEIGVANQAQAKAVGFVGSPTIRIDGVDIESAARSGRQPGMGCRIYLEGEKVEGIPSRNLIRMAIRQASSL